MPQDLTCLHADHLFRPLLSKYSTRCTAASPSRNLHAALESRCPLRRLAHVPSDSHHKFFACRFHGQSCAIHSSVTSVYALILWPALFESAKIVSHVTLVPFHYLLYSPSPRHGSLNIKPGIRPPRFLDLLSGHRLLNLGYCHQFLDLHDLTCDLRRDWVEDCAHTFAQAEGAEDAGCFAGETDGGTDECDAEEGHVVCGLWCVVGERRWGSGFVGGV